MLSCRRGTPEASGWDTPSQPSSSGHFFSRHSAGHLGYAGTSLSIDFERKIAVVLLTNRTWPRRESQAIHAACGRYSTIVMGALEPVPSKRGLECHHPKVFAWLARRTPYLKAKFKSR